MRLSPGSQYRLLTDHLEWSELSLWKKFATGYDNFLFESFINNKPTIFLFSLVLILLMVYSKKNVNIIYRALSIIINALCLFALCSNHVISNNNILLSNKKYKGLRLSLHPTNKVINELIINIGQKKKLNQE